MAHVNTPARLRALRTVMNAHQIDAYLVLSSDPHLSEYLPEHWQSRAWLSGFDGSAGTLLVTAHEAGLWTDSRYWAQAEHSLEGSGITLFKQGAPGVLGPTEFLQQHLPKGAVVCVDAQVMPLSDFEAWQKTASKAGWHIQSQDVLLDTIWADRPALPHAAIYAHDADFNGRRRDDNLRLIREQMDQAHSQWHLISSLDDIAWVLGLRGADVDYNPVFLSHLLLGQEQGWLFVAPEKLDDTVRQKLARDGIQVQPYEQLDEFLTQLPKQNYFFLTPTKATVGLLSPALNMKWTLWIIQVLCSRRVKTNLSNHTSVLSWFKTGLLCVSFMLGSNVLWLNA